MIHCPRSSSTRGCYSTCSKYVGRWGRAQQHPALSFTRRRVCLRVAVPVLRDGAAADQHAPGHGVLPLGAAQALAGLGTRRARLPAPLHPHNRQRDVLGNGVCPPCACCVCVCAVLTNTACEHPWPARRRASSTAAATCARALSLAVASSSSPYSCAPCHGAPFPHRFPSCPSRAVPGSCTS